MKERLFISYFHWSAEVITVTCVVLLVVAECLIPMQEPMPWIRWSIALAILAPILYCATWTPRYLLLKGDNLVLKKIVGGITIPVQNIHAIYPITADAIKNSIRVFGSGGAFGYLGRFKNNIFGNYIMYITERKNLIVIKTHDKTYVFNCNDRDRLIDLIKESSHD